MVHEEHKILGSLLKENVECKVKFDGAWRKRGHTSLRCAVTAISAETGKCLDYETERKMMVPKTTNLHIINDQQILQALLLLWKKKE